MEKTLYDPIQIPPLSKSFSVLAKLIFHFLGHVFWFSAMLLLIIMAVHGAFPLTDDLLQGALEFRSVVPPFDAVDVSPVVHEAVLGLMRLMAVSIATAIAAVLVGGALLMVLSLLVPGCRCKCP